MSMLRYIELKSGFGDRGPAWIARVQLSRSKTTVYFNGRALKKAKGGGISGNYFDLESGEEYWVSGIKKNGEDRHSTGSGPVLVEATAVEEHLSLRGLVALDPKQHGITESIVQTDIAKFKNLENLSNWSAHFEEEEEEEEEEQEDTRPVKQA
ncbi:hypothetical protein VVD49_09715 [Uliginosibacterium sp. H3]|uniref:Uncharacterized protein n=1 Tax=Uliginosibacterium silvisoli TaxID=3114758 RepID=A0ABU6K3F7_9RHOO|nr:hypothetical protein [Uliginosibacterium sp. H3]